MEASVIMWNRLESSLRNENQLDNALRFEIRDALWMLTRQWQFGEFEGEDAGTAAFANITSEQSQVSGIGSSSGQMRSFDVTSVPFEKEIEHEAFLPDVATRLEMGRHFERILMKRLPAATASTVITQLRNSTRLQFTRDLPADDARITKFQLASYYSDQENLLLIDSLSSGKAIDGYLLIRAITSGNAASSFLSQSNDQVNKAGTEFVEWYNRVYGQQANGNSWHPQHMEYQPQLAFIDESGQPKVVAQEEYFGDGFEWHGFQAKPASNPPMPATNIADKRTANTSTVIPSGVRFRGMPSVRLWEMEDATVDFGDIKSSSTELNKMIFAEFGLVYGNDWLTAPVQFRGGNMCRINSIVVTDTFGQETHMQEITPDNDFAFFQTPLTKVSGSRWLFLANTSSFISEGPPVEKVTFMRDEMANMVWGVEEIVMSPYGGGRDGESLAKKTTEFVKSLSNQTVVPNNGAPAVEGWIYKAGTLMAENRIPFIAMSVADQSPAFSKRIVVLQRAAIPRVGDDFAPVRIRPRTTLLGHMGKNDARRPEPLFLFEEEVPRSGMALSLVWKRVRGLNGQTHTWLARKKSLGVGEIDGNFKFDFVTK
ncbi:hypothetical protein WBG78_19220 [Chryseolinea sp. T2]|uniref:hypothetical protein n=1 Tax=Chryseolinea sp. T2 TaxID=3129255 RepID=UPI003076E4DA